ncbi:MAG: hypothetical protein ABI833_21050, partial [Acidobacteriota bacterium]
AVNKIRDALGDSAAVPRYVETVAGRGYRFLAPVTAASSDKQVTAAAPAEDAEGAGARLETEQSRDATGVSGGTFLTTPEELPTAPRALVRNLLLLVQAMYLGFYLGALANLSEINDIFVEANLSHPAALMVVLVTTAAALIPIRLFIIAAVALDFRNLQSKFGTLFPALLIFDLLWAVSPFLLIHHINAGLALGLSAPLVYLPFAQRSLVLMYSRERLNAVRT